MKKTLLFILLFICCLSLSAQSFKIISYNILEGMKMDTSQKKQKFVEWLKHQNPDILAIQEANKFTEQSLSELAKSYGHPYAVLVKESGYPTALTSKYPIENIEKVNEGITHGFIAAQIKGINIVVLHLNPHDYQRRRNEIKQITDKISKKFDKKNLLVMGDFNSFTPLEKEVFDNGVVLSNIKKAQQRSNGRHNNLINGEELDFEVQQHLLDYDLVDVLKELEKKDPKNAYNIIPQTYRIDYIYCSKDMIKKVKSGLFIRDYFTKKYSDHLPIAIEIKL
ncbi:endonuclease/exonuclease/phosphatase family protein [Pseudopedobacter beijingensis]|uniref:Endonuclease/exonuclease/phosphatase family protein n=1 Tax=Pseudopedobacter beijingensis TaxID=1207056 RepID=A0ABW4ICE6_9SPHI